MKISELNRADYNPRKISSKAKSGLSKSIDKFGLLNLIIWNRKTGNVVGGHQRLDILVGKGETEADVVVIDVEPADEVALNIALNNPAVAGEYTEAALSQLQSIKDSIGDDFNSLLFTDLESELERISKRAEKSIKEDAEIPEMEPIGDMDVGIPQIESIACIRCPKCKKEWRMDRKV